VGYVLLGALYLYACPGKIGLIIHNSKRMKMTFRGSGYYCVTTTGEILYRPTKIVDGIGAAKYFNSPGILKWWWIRNYDKYRDMIEIIKTAHLQKLKEKGILKTAIRSPG